MLIDELIQKRKLFIQNMETCRYGIYSCEYEVDHFHCRRCGVTTKKDGLCFICSTASMMAAKHFYDSLDYDDWAVRLARRLRVYDDWVERLAKPERDK